MKRSCSTVWPSVSTKCIWDDKQKIISGFRAADFCLLIPEMFTEIAFETNKMTNKEHEIERDNRA
jgi:hypothetical protein